MVTEHKSKISIIYDLLDMAILPAALLICAKALGMAILNVVLKLDWNVTTISHSIFSIKTTYPSQEDVELVVSYTNLFMFIVVLAGSMVITSKSLLFHDKVASPHFVLKLAKYDLLHLLKTSFHIYKEAFVWGLFLILTTIYIFISFLAGQTYGWIAGVSVLFCITFLWMMIDKIEQDLIFNNYK